MTRPLVLTKPVPVRAISRSTGISVAHISRIFNGQSNPTLVTASKLARYLNCTLDDLAAHLVSLYP